MNRSMPGLPVHHQLLEFTQTHVHRVGDAIQPSHLLSSPSPPAFNHFQHWVSNESVLHIRWPKYWSFSFTISPSKEHPGLISFRMDWLDLLAVQRTLKSFLKHHSAKASILWRSAFFTVQLSHPYNDYWKNHSLDCLRLLIFLPASISLLLPGKSHGQRSLVGHSPWGLKRVGNYWATKQQQINICI